MYMYRRFEKITPLSLVVVVMGCAIVTTSSCKLDKRFTRLLDNVEIQQLFEQLFQRQPCLRDSGRNR